jgi:hypothetical protein
MKETPPGTPGASRRRQRPGPAARAGVAALLAALVLLGALEIHPAAEAHDPIAGLAGAHQDVYFPNASHPVDRPHAEAATAVPLPACAACLNRLQGRGARLAPAAHLARLVAGHPLPPNAAIAPLQQSLRPDGARAPPLA